MLICAVGLRSLRPHTDERGSFTGRALACKAGPESVQEQARDEPERITGKARNIGGHWTFRAKAHTDAPFDGRRLTLHARPPEVDPELAIVESHVHCTVAAGCDHTSCGGTLPEP